MFDSVSLPADPQGDVWGVLVEQWARELDVTDGVGDRFADPSDAGWDSDEPVAAGLLAPSVADLDAVVARIRALGPGPAAALALDAVDATALSEAGRLELLAAWQAQTAWTEARAADALVTHVGTGRLSRRSLTVTDAQMPAHLRLAEAALVLRTTERSLRARYEVAVDLHRRLPATAAALLAGEIGWYQAMVVSEALTHLPDPVAARVEARVLADAGRLSTGRLRRRLRSALARLDTDGKAEQARFANRHVERGGTPDGAAFLTVWSDPRDIQAMWKALTVLAGPGDADDPRPIAARRVDALLAMCLAATTPTGDPDHDAAVGQAAPRRANPPVEVQVVVDLATLAGLADNPAELTGHGPIPAGIVRDWLADATCWRRLVTDPVTGHLLDYGPKVRFAPPRLAAFLAARDHTCTFPGCRQPADRCDNDHEPPWRPDGTGGHTSAGHMAPTCRHHHRWKTHHGWTLQRQPDGTSRWTSPTGRTYDVLRRPTLGAEWQTDTVEPWLGEL